MDNSNLEGKKVATLWLNLESVDTKKILLAATFILINLYLIFCDPRKYKVLRCSKNKGKNDEEVFGL